MEKESNISLGVSIFLLDLFAQDTSLGKDTVKQFLLALKNVAQ